MSNKLTYEYVKEYIEFFGYKLISDIYINAHSSLKVKCDQGHIYEVTFNNFKSGKRCPECSKYNGANARRLPLSKVKDDIEKNGNLKLLSKEYKNNSSPLLIKCNKGHTFTISYSALQQNHMTCPECTKQKIKESLAFSYTEVKIYIESFGYKLLSTSYENTSEYLYMECPNGHIVHMKYNNFRAGKRCRICSMKEMGNKKRFTYDYIKSYIESFEGYELLSTEYINASKKLQILCPKGHEFACSYNKFKQGQRCPICQESKGESSRQYFELLKIT